MITNSLKVIGRSLYRDSAYSIINIIGLAVGLACCALLALFLFSELTYDQHFAKHERIFRVASELNVNGNINLSAETAYALGPMLVEGSPEIELATRISFAENNANTTFKLGDTAFKWEKVAFVDDTFFDIFDHEIVAGNSEAALGEPNSLAVSETFAKRYFGNENPVGKLIANGISEYKIDLVFKDLPDNSHIKYDVLISYLDLPEFRVRPTINDRTRHDLWYSKTDYTYVLMPENFEPDRFASISKEFFDKNLASYEDSFNSSVSYYLEPLARIHLNSDTQRDLPRGNKFYIWAFIASAAFILAIACINYMNLSTARLTKRAKEIAIRKVLGASRRDLVFQFITESLVFSFIALALGLVFVFLVLKYTSLAGLFGKSLSMAPLFTPSGLLLLITMALVIGLISGIYPALQLSAAAPIGRVKLRNAKVRHVLVFLQFLVSVFVIACTLVMYFQMKYFKEKPLGYERDNKIVMVVNGADQVEQIPVFANELQTDDRVLSVSSSIREFGGNMAASQAEVENNDGTYSLQSYNWFYVSKDYIDTIGVELSDGRNFDPDNRADLNNSVLVNETFVEKMRWDQAIGKGIQYEQGSFVYVIGVMKDFHYRGLQHEIEPLMFWLAPPASFENWDERTLPLATRHLIVDLSPNDVQGGIQYIRDRWREFSAEHPFEYRFLDDVLDQYYTSDIKQMKLIGIFAGLSILVSCLGLFGLTAFVTEQRTKEIGIRKVLGASSSGIILMLFKNILYILFFAAIVASVAAFFVMSKWLQGFYYHDVINPAVFAAAAVVAIVISFATVWIQAHKVAEANPADALRYE